MKDSSYSQWILFTLNKRVKVTIEITILVIDLNIFKAEFMLLCNKLLAILLIHISLY